MLSSADLVAFVPTSRPERAKRFYREVLGLTLVSDDSFALVFDANGTSLRVEKVEGLQPHPFTVVGWRVADIAAAVATLTSRGVRFERYPSLQQDAGGVWGAPGGAQVAWFKDPDGNTLSLTQNP